MTGLEDLRPEHKERPAFVYARQSTMAQVVQHRTSTERQYGLGAVAEQLGWPRLQVQWIDADLGRSGKFSENRQGFQRLMTEVGLGRVGAIFSLEVSRLARSSADWHRLLEIAGLTRTLPIDEQTIYDPRDMNDRLVLGMKGTMADFELVRLRQRMEGGRWHLARKGEYRMHQPAGYVYEGNRLAMDPDEEVRRAVALVFERYRVAGSSSDVLRYFAQQGVRFPVRLGTRVVWDHLTRTRLGQVLRNPTCAGTYVFGRGRGCIDRQEGAGDVAETRRNKLK